MRAAKGLPKLLFELPVWAGPGLLLLGIANAASGGRLWPALLQTASAGLLTAENAWSFAVTVGITAALGLGLLLEPCGRLLEFGTDALLHRRGASPAFEWLQVHEERGAEFAEERRAAHRLCNALAAALLAGAAVMAGYPGHAAAIGGLVVVALAAALLGARMKTAWLAQTERLRTAAGERA